MKREDYYELLTQAIIKQAYEDLCYSLTPTPPGNDNREIRYQKMFLRDDVMNFFNSNWYASLTLLPPEILVKRAIQTKAVKMAKEWKNTFYRRKDTIRKKSRQIDFDWTMDCKKIDDRRKGEYEKRIKARQKRLKGEAHE